MTPDLILDQFDLAAKNFSEHAMTASNLVAELSGAWKILEI